MMRSMQLLAVACVAALVVGARAAQGGLITFETGFGDKDPVASISTGDNVVSISTLGSPGAFIAEVGFPTTAFFGISDDTTLNSSVSGTFFLTDEQSGPATEGDFTFAFDRPVSDLQLDLYDYDLGSLARLRVFSDSARTIQVGSDSVGLGGNGAIQTLAVTSPSANIRSAILEFPAPDIGVGVDNIEFTTVPEPSSLLGWGLIGMVYMLVVGARRRRRAKQVG